MTGCPDSPVHQYTLVAVALLLASLLLGYACWRSARRSRAAGSRWRRVGRLLAAATLLLLAAPLTTAGGYLLWYTHRPRPDSVSRKLFEHVRYRREVLVHPRPLVVHVVTVEMGQPRVRFVVTPGRPGSRQLRGQTTSSFLRQHRLQLAINGQIFYPWRSGFFDYYPRAGDPVNVVGLNAASGVIYAQPTGKHPTLFIDRHNRARIGWLDRERDDVYHAISGTRMLVDGGRVAADVHRRQDLICQPRTAVGLAAAGRRMVLVVVDGRQPNYSEGVNLAELARILKRHRVHDAINLDGGGSSTLVIEGPDGEPLVLSSPIDRRLPGRERVVANHLGVVVSSPNDP